MRADSDPQDFNGGPHVSRGESFVSSAMIVWWSSTEMDVCVDEWKHFYV